MARRKKSLLNISDWTVLEWTEQGPEIGDEIYGQCDFCGGDIRVTEHYFFGSIPNNTIQNPGDLVFQACTRCVQQAGIKW